MISMFFLYGGQHSKDAGVKVIEGSHCWNLVRFQYLAHKFSWIKGVGK